VAEPAVVWVEDADAFAALAPEWDALAAPQRNPFLLHAWFDAWWSAFGDGLRLRICSLRRDGALVALFPLCVRGRVTRGIANVHTQVFKPVAADDESLGRLVDVAVAAAGELELWAVPVADASLPLLRAACRSAGRVAFEEPLHTSPIVELDDDFAAYRARLGGSTRRGIDRSRRRLESDHDVHLEILAAPTDVDAELARGFELEASGWKGREGTAILSSPANTRFFRDLGRAFHRLGKLRLSTIVVDGRLGAWELCVLEQGRLWSLKGAYDESLARYSPGAILRLATIERCYDLGIDGNELLGFDPPWKRRFATSDRAHCVFRAYPRRPVSFARYAYRERVRPRAKALYIRHGGLRARRLLRLVVARVRRAWT
jgi:CelD/BcsL family acetyltransferase involved in cellulose biosynthesis